MAVGFVHRPHPRIVERQKVGPPRTRDEHVGLNGRIALVLTSAVGTMWCAYAFALLALVALPQALSGGLLAFIQWLSQTFIQLVMLSVIMVGQNILGRAADKRAEMTYRDAEAAFHEAEQIQAHLAAQDRALGELLDRISRLEAELAASAGDRAAAAPPGDPMPPDPMSPAAGLRSPRADPTPPPGDPTPPRADPTPPPAGGER